MRQENVQSAELLPEDIRGRTLRADDLLLIEHEGRWVLTHEVQVGAGQTAFVAVPARADVFNQLADVADTKDRLFELINGEIVEKLPTDEHGYIAARFIIKIGNFLDQHDLGRIGTEVRHQSQADDKNVFLPDVSVILNTRAIDVVTRGSIPGLPDLAVEIKSPTDKLPEMHDKAMYYIRNGTRLVWLVIPASRVIHIYRAGNDDIEILTADDMLTGDDVLPGFTLPVVDLFPKR